MSLPDRVASIVLNVAAEHKISPRDLLGDSRYRPFVRARQEAMRACRAMEWCGGVPSFPVIGRWFGRDHTTIIHACRGMATDSSTGCAFTVYGPVESLPQYLNDSNIQS